MSEQELQRKPAQEQPSMLAAETAPEPTKDRTTFSAQGQLPPVAASAAREQPSASERGFATDTAKVAPGGPVRMKAVFVDQARRFALEINEETGRTYLSIPVRNSKGIEYDEWYEVDKETFEKFRANPTLAHDMAGQAKRREIDHLLLLKPGSDRGVPF